MKMGLFSESWILDFLVLFLSICLLILLLVRQRYTYWERKGFKSLPNLIEFSVWSLWANFYTK